MFVTAVRIRALTSCSERERKGGGVQRDKQTVRQKRESQIDRQRDRDRQTQTDRQIETDIDKQRE